MERKLLNYFSLFLLLFSIQANGAEILSQLNGKVVNNEKGVPFIAVYVKDTNVGAITDAQGNFALEIVSGSEFTLAVQGLGYKSVYLHLDQSNLFDCLNIEIEEDILLLEQVVVSGSRVGVLRFLPGSACVVTEKELKNIQPLSGNDVFRNISGVHVVEEEGAGLRTNIGIRGLDPDKSRNVLILEDGIPVALAPYGEPEMYFTPSIDRMSGVEVLKGNGSILFGPQTIGGVINYITADPPSESSGYANLYAGEKGFYNARIGYGNTEKNFGYKVDFQRKQAENFGPTSFIFHDFQAKLLARISPESNLSLKLGIYDENSNSTYIGLTEPMYKAGIYDELKISPDDNLHIRRYAISGIHKYSPADRLQINTTAFAYTTVRNWKRQDFTYNASASNLTGVMHGFDDEIEGAIYMRNSTGNRNRQFEVAGIEPRISYYYDLGNITSKTDAGVRFLYEKAFEQRIVGTSAGFNSGGLRDDEIRSGQTISTYLQNKFILTDKLTFTAGVRNENIWYEREILRVNNVDTLIKANSDVFTLLPGAGLNYNINNNIGIFTGVHRGFAPPRTKDAISNDGVNLELDAEKSWNTELGTRMNIFGVKIEYTLFYMDFSNQVIPVSESSGGIGVGYINGGSTIHKGMEAALIIPFNMLFSRAWDVELSMAATYTNSTFSGDRFVLKKKPQADGYENEYVNIKGNKTPYSPELTIASALTVEHEKGFGIRLSGNYIGSQFTDVLNTVDVYQWIALDESDDNFQYVQATANGRIGKLDPYFVANVSIWYEHIKSGLGLNVSVKNILDERYIVSRRPQGIRVGMPRFISVGLTYSF
jgi:Fe(3+) dicitrate transport protein